MHPRHKFLAAAAATAALLVPAQAEAHDRASVKSVKSHLAAAEAALDTVAAQVVARDQAAAAAAFARNRLEMRRAQAETARVRRAGVKRGAMALQAVARRQEANAEDFTALLDAATGDLQVQVAKALAASVKARDLALAQLAALAERLPEPARAAIAAVIAAVLQDADEDVRVLSSSLGSAGIAPAARPWIELALTQVTEGVAVAMSQLEALLPALPTAAQGPVRQALEQVDGVLGMVSGILQGILGGAPGEGGSLLEGLPIPFPFRD